MSPFSQGPVSSEEPDKDDLSPGNTASGDNASALDPSPDGSAYGLRSATPATEHEIASLVSDMLTAFSLSCTGSQDNDDDHSLDGQPSTVDQSAFPSVTDSASPLDTDAESRSVGNSFGLFLDSHAPPSGKLQFYSKEELPSAYQGPAGSSASVSWSPGEEDLYKE